MDYSKAIRHRAGTFWHMENHLVKKEKSFAGRILTIRHRNSATFNFSNNNRVMPNSSRKRPISTLSQLNCSIMLAVAVGVAVS
jgi:hypothetical protein